ncbi:MAG: alpha/beta hydrolase [Pseudomonadota bacterium]
MTVFTKEKEVMGVMQREFSVVVQGETVPCVIWAPLDAAGPRTLIVMGHGGSQHKKTVSIRSRAVAYARSFGWATLVADAPGHGDRISREEAMALSREVGARVRGESGAAPMDESRMRLMADRGRQAVSEWQAALDMAQSFDFVGNRHPVGYWGVSMGTAFGVPFVAAEPRIRCAVFGLAGLRPGATEMAEAAASITVPVEFVFQWEDAVAPREAGLALFNAFASREKSMHINPGGHMGIPDFEQESWARFFQRHLVD